MRRWVWMGVLAGAFSVACGEAAEPGADARGDIGLFMPDLPTGDPVRADVTRSEDTGTSSCEGLGEGAACDDGDPCTLDDSCASGVCVGGSTNPCESESACMTGACVPGVGCEFAPVADGASCVVACYGQASCVAGVCEVDAASQVTCPAPPSDKPCVTALQCDPATGTCTEEIKAPAGAPCDTDSNLCALEACDADGVCQDQGETNDCAAEKSGAPCELWTCSVKTGECQSGGFAGAFSCDDGNSCTEADTCTVDEAFGFIGCKGTPIPVDDSNPCTDDKCVDGTITHEPINGKPCSPKSECSETGLCAEGACVPTDTCECVEDAACDDANPCTSDSCGPDNTCVNTPNASPCDDDNVCTLGDACVGGGCVGSSVLDCKDENPCTLDGCDPDAGCDNSPIVAPCDDDDPCTENDGCVDGDCAGVPTPSCCGNGIIEPGETCEGASCPTQCPDPGECKIATLAGSAQTCDAECETSVVKACVSGDGCCPVGCSAAMDSDCGAVCGNGVVEDGETCDGDCPTSCSNTNPCKKVALLGSADNCDAQCAVIGTNQCWVGVNECVIEIAVQCHSGPFPASSWSIKALDNGTTGALAPHGHLYYVHGGAETTYADVLTNFCLNEVESLSVKKSGCIAATYELGSCVGPYTKTCKALHCYTCP